MLGKQILIELLLYKILKLLRIKFIKNKKFIKTSNSSNILLTSKKIIGQKENEELSFKDEILNKVKNDKSIFKIKLSTNKTSKIDKDLKKISKYNFLKISTSRISQKYTKNNRGNKISHQL